ncbi:type II-A CRISPR-associated protein Csn2 [Paucilactobacillus kaifaensis]|uniref:type II-A CRISPR-associated protein Csn2 n=1 Tax=Paucilactobacillus kaifaensis TaxID=2559921 RepID=UPI0010F61E8E|nr:type II-A CRISPR-associated protein Csn2 [Paucilactobacillus kaifaensis]
MKMTMFPFKPFEVNAGKPTVIETGSHEIYQKLILNFRDLKDDIKFSNDNFETVDTSKAMLWVGDSFVQADLNKLFQHSLNKKIVSLVNDDQMQQIFELSQQLKQVILESSYLMDLPLTIEEQTDIAKVIKFSEISFAKEINVNPYGIIETILKTAKELNLSSIVGFMNVTDYLTENEFSDLIESVKSLDVQILIIKFSESRRAERYNGCRYYYIDHDYVDLRESE